MPWLLASPGHQQPWFWRSPPETLWLHKWKWLICTYSWCVWPLIATTVVIQVYTIPVVWYTVVICGSKRFFSNGSIIWLYNHGSHWLKKIFVTRPKLSSLAEPCTGSRCDNDKVGVSAENLELSWCQLKSYSTIKPTVGRPSRPRIFSKYNAVLL